MKEIRFTLDDQDFKRLKENTDQAKISVIAGEALSLFNWALEEVRNGRKIVSMNPAEDDITEIITPTLQRLKNARVAATTATAAVASVAATSL